MKQQKASKSKEVKQLAHNLKAQLRMLLLGYFAEEAKTKHSDVDVDECGSDPLSKRARKLQHKLNRIDVLCQRKQAFE